MLTPKRIMFYLKAFGGELRQLCTPAPDSCLRNGSTVEPLPAHLKPWRWRYPGETRVLLPLESALGSLQIFNPGVEGIFFQRRYYEDCLAPKIP